MGFPLYPAGGYTSGSTPSFPFQPITGSEIDLRREMKNLLEGTAGTVRRGHWIILRRMDQRQRCFCWNEQGKGEEKLTDDHRKYDEPKPRCQVCDGDGWIYTDELHLSRRRITSPEVGLAAQKEISDIGYMSVNYIVYYLQYYVNPSNKDIIFEIELDSTGAPVRPFVFKERYAISVAESFRDQNGRIEYWRVACKMEIT